MSSLIVKLNTPSDRRWSGALPVEIRDSSNCVLRARGFTEEPIEVPPGRYLVTATLPDGQQAGTDDLVDIEAGETKEMILSSDEIEIPQTLQSTAPWGDSVKQLVQPITRLFVTQPAALVRGSSFTSWLKSSAEATLLKRQAIAKSTIDVTLADGPVLLEIATAKDRFTYFAIPVDVDGTTTVQWRIETETGTPTVRFDFNGPLNSFFDYVQAGFAPEAKSLSQPLTREAELYVQTQKSPLRVALAAYVLLRANDLQSLDVPTDVLFQTCPWLPDALAIRMEYLARKARHDEAIALLQRQPAWGMPWFRSGVVYAAFRAKAYARLTVTKNENVHTNVEPRVLAGLAEALDQIAESLDQSKTTAVFRNVPRLV